MKLSAYLELHIEQGPILEAEEKTIGVVSGVQGMRWYEVTVTGQDAHTGATPMYLRKNALLGAARAIDRIDAIASAHAPAAVGTVGLVEVRPNSRNVIPGEVFFTVDFRHPDEAELCHDPLRRRVVNVGDADELLQAQLHAELERRGAALSGEALTPQIARDHPADFGVVRMRDMPVVEVHLVPSAEAPGGVGEPGIVPPLAAIANAVAHATGVRQTQLPMSPRRILETTRGIG